MLAGGGPVGDRWVQRGRHGVVAFAMRVLGSIELDRDGVGVPMGPVKRRAMFAALALEANRPVSLGRLCAAVWSGVPPASAVANLRTHAAALRRHLGDRLVARQGGYLLRVEVGELDVDRFTTLAARGRSALADGDFATAAASLTAALDTWRGAVGDDLPTGTSLARRFVALEDQRLSVLEDCVQARMAVEPYADVVPELRRHLAGHPLRERAWGQLMLALYRSGDPAAALAAYGQARAVFRDDLGVELGPELRALQQAVLTRAAHLSPPSAVHPAGERRSGRRPGAPRQLPPHPAVFIGRADALAALDRALTPGDARSVITISGEGGVGKSALALCAVKAAAQRFPDGRVWVDLRGNRAGTPRLSTGEALARALRALGVPAGDVLPTIDERAAQYRFALAQRRVLVLLDNAVDAAHVRALVPAEPGSAVLVTSRRRLATLDATTHLALAPMPDTEALALLVALAGVDRVAAEPLAVDQLVRRCAGLPLALRIVGARLASRPNWPLAHLANRLTDGPALLDELSHEDLSLRACFEAGYQPLAAADEDAGRAFRLLGTLPPGDLTAHQVTRRLGVGAGEAGPVLERLVDAQLLHCVRPGQYRIPELLHRYAAELAAGCPHDTRVDRAHPVLGAA
jgi:DNA-binding SARP family transcriptional activator